MIKTVTSEFQVGIYVPFLCEHLSSPMLILNKNLRIRLQFLTDRYTLVVTCYVIYVPCPIVPSQSGSALIIGTRLRSLLWCFDLV